MSDTITVRFHRRIYRGEQVDAAVKALANYGSFALREEDTHWVVDVEASSHARARRLARELGNHVLGRTIQAIQAEAEGGGA